MTRCCPTLPFQSKTYKHGCLEGIDCFCHALFHRCPAEHCLFLLARLCLRLVLGWAVSGLSASDSSFFPKVDRIEAACSLVTSTSLSIFGINRAPDQFLVPHHNYYWSRLRFLNLSSFCIRSCLWLSTLSSSRQQALCCCSIDHSIIPSVQECTCVFNWAS